MATAILDTPMTLDTRAAAQLVIRGVHIHLTSPRSIDVIFELVDSSGVVVDRRVVNASGAGVQNWISNQEAALYNQLMSKLGVTGTVG